MENFSKSKLSTDDDLLAAELHQRKTVERFAVGFRHIAQFADGDLLAEQNRFASKCWGSFSKNNSP